MRFASPLIPRRSSAATSVSPTCNCRTAADHRACRQSGAMTGLATPGARVWLSKSASKTRKLPYSWELVEADFGAGPELVGVNTGHPNPLIGEALAARAPELAAYSSVREVKSARRPAWIPAGRRRPAALLPRDQNVHLMRQPGLAEFPDSVCRRRETRRTWRHGRGRRPRHDALCDQIARRDASRSPATSTLAMARRSTGRAAAASRRWP